MSVNNNNTKTSSNGSIYDKSFSDMTADERVKFQRDLFTSIKKMAVSDINKSSRSSSFLAKFDIKQISGWLQNPSKSEKQIRQLSQYLFNVSPHYRRLILYMSQMPMYAYTVDPVDIPDNVDVEKYKKQYKKTLLSIEKMNLKHEMTKIAKTVFREDFYYGYIFESKDSFFIQKQNPDYCRISSIEDGVFNFAFDFSYFNGNQELLNSYPIEFQQKFKIYKNTGIKNQWQELSSENTVCFKLQDDLDYGLPIFNTMFEAIFDLDEYKKLKKSKTKADNFMTLIQKIPIDDKAGSMNNFLIDLELAAGFHSQASAVLPENIGLITSPMSVESIRMDQTKSTNDVIAQATREVFSDAGISQHLFNSDKTTSTGLNQSIFTDEAVIFGFMRQVERWINRRLKRQTGQYKFKFKFLDITIFNQEKKSEMYLKGVQSALPVINEAAASIGVSPLDLLNKAKLESDILGLHDILKPLQTSYTQSNKESAGRDKLDDDEISDSGQVNRDNNTDENRE